MPNYRYQVRTSAGQVQVGVLSADSVSTAAKILRNQGAHVLAISPVAASISRSQLVERLRNLNSGKISQKHVLDFTTQLAVMIRAGINLRASLDGIAEQTEHAGFRRIINSLKSDVESGKQFSDAIARHPKLFNPLYVNMVRASEMSGSFSRMLDRIAQYIAQEIETRKMVISASIYPAVIGTMAIGVTVFLLVFVLPKFYMVFQGKEDMLPWATKFLMGLSELFVSNWPYIVGVVISSSVGLFIFAKTEVGGLFFDKAKLSVPVLKIMFRSLYISRSLQTMGQLINAGVPMLDTIAITGEVSGNRLYQSMWRKVYTSVKQGRKIVAPLQKTRLLPRAVVQMMSAGEESGKLGEVLDEVSGFYTKQLKDQIKAVTALIEPLMIIVMGAIVGFIAMAVILPIFKMSQIVG
ncbi:MAG: type II secretion system F family protein [Planctomycetes bacterium]|nr:type II secretion system F family protein [Planctomycetota bacterium]MCH7962217.1 type II secretion system F family protein [Planctomycetota bacterium]MCH9057505.1 type II secretion system F family protein [Planctomycetota bacterium]